MKPATFQKEALALANIGLRILPIYGLLRGQCSCNRGANCKSAGKHPRILDWQNQATTDPDKIKSWFERWPMMNFGIAAGPGSGVLILDVDGEAGKRSLEGKEIPKTPTAKTGSGGLHYYFSDPGIELPNEVRILPGLDIRTDGGQVVAPPSRHKSGNKYEWIISPFEQSFAECPEWLLEALQNDREEEVEKEQVIETVPYRSTANTPRHTNGTENKGKRAYLDKVLASNCEKISNAAQGTRHEVAYNQARVMGGYLAGEYGILSESEVENRLLDAAMSFPDADPVERKAAIWDGLADGKKAPLYVPPMKTITFTVKGKSVDRLTGEILEDEEDEEEYEDEKEEGGEQKAGKSSQAKLDRELVKFDPNDEGNAQAFIHLHGDKFLYCKAYGWLSYNDRFWKMDNAEFKLHDMVVKTLERRRVAAVRTREETVVKVTNASATNTRNCISMVQPKLATDVESFDADPNLLNCQNGIVDLRTGELVAHDPSQRFTYCIKVPYDPEADYSEWITFLHEVVGGGDEIIDYLQLAIGYSFTGYTREECLFYLFGPTRSGKGTFTETLFTLLGLPMSIEADFNTFTAKRDQDASNFDLAPLKPARLVFASESNRYQTLNPAKIKQLTGGNWIRCSFKHKDFFAYRPQFKVWLSSNWEVNADVDDDAMWGRVKVIKFPNSYLGREDKDLKRRLIAPENLTGILRWAIEGAMRWYNLPHGLQTPKLVQDTTAEHRQLADYVQSWLNEYTEKDETYWEPNTAVMSSYLRWCKENNIEPKAAKGLATTLRTKGYLPSVQNKFNGINTRGVQGLKVLISGNSS